jgi:hypothetical protein
MVDAVQQLFFGPIALAVQVPGFAEDRYHLGVHVAAQGRKARSPNPPPLLRRL